jgi:hypothetical protein
MVLARLQIGRTGKNEASIAFIRASDRGGGKYAVAKTGQTSGDLSNIGTIWESSANVEAGSESSGPILAWVHAWVPFSVRAKGGIIKSIGALEKTVPLAHLATLCAENDGLLVAPIGHTLYKYKGAEEGSVHHTSKGGLILTPAAAEEHGLLWACKNENCRHRGRELALAHDGAKTGFMFANGGASTAKTFMEWAFARRGAPICIACSDCGKGLQWVLKKGTQVSGGGARTHVTLVDIDANRQLRTGGSSSEVLVAL